MHAMIDIPVTELSGEALIYACELASAIDDGLDAVGDDDFMPDPDALANLHDSAVAVDDALTLAESIALKNKIAVQHMRGTWIATGASGIGYLANEKHTAIGRSTTPA